MVVWDVQTGNPIWSVSKPHPFGVQALQLTPDGHSLVAMSALEPGGTVQQIISIWDLSSPAQTPVFTTAIPAGEQKNCFCLSPDGSELITNGKAHICFWGLTSKSVGLVTSPTRAMEFKRAVGDFTMSSFLPDGQQVQPCLCNISAFFLDKSAST